MLKLAERGVMPSAQAVDAVMAGTPPAQAAPAAISAAAAALVSLPGTFDDPFRGSVALLLGHRMGLADFALLLVLCGAAAWTSLVYVVRAN